MVVRTREGGPRPYSAEMMWRRRLAIAVASVVALLAVLSGALTLWEPSRSSAAALLVLLAVSVPASGLGVLITRRAAGAQVGALLALVALVVAITGTREIAWTAIAEEGRVAESLSWLVAATAEGAWWVLVAVALLMLYFPDGAVPSRRWRWVPPAIVACAVITQVYGALEDRPFRPPLEDLQRPFPAPPSWFVLLADVAFVAMLVLFLACAVSLFIRFRRAGRVQRQQIRWLAIGGFGVILYPFLCLAEFILQGHPGWVSGAVAITALVGLPVATAVAVLRHDLYDVDKALAVAVTWGLVTVVLLTVYAAVSSIAGALLGRDSSLIAACVAAVCALALSPLRKRLQARVDRRLYPLRVGALGAIDQFYRDVSTGDGMPEALEAVLRDALHDPGLRVGFRQPGAAGFVDVDGRPVSRGGGHPVVVGGSQIGVVAPKGPEASAELVREVARRAAPLVEMVRLRMELAGTLREVESSRARLVQVGYEERRRLERDVHDGAQQRLVSLGMSIRLAQRHLDDGTVDINNLLDESVAELGTAVAELRQLAHGIRPSSLDDGLPAAVARLVRGAPVMVDLDVDSHELPDDIATTAYFVISESVANAVKHADASRICLRVHRRDGQVLVRVSDDGRGGAVLRPESGLADRVAALGGHVDVVSPAGQGTVVEAVMPCVS